MAGNTNLELFMAKAAERGSSIAITDPAFGLKMTYAGLNEYSDRVAAKLHALGIGYGDNVALVMREGIDEIAAMLAAMKLGAVFVPLNPDYPRERLEYIFKDCDAKLEVTPDFFSDVMTYEPHKEERAVSGDDVALIIYTSGSTGFPKGVMIDQRALYEHTDSVINENDVVGLGAPFYFVAGIWNLFGGLSKGSTCVCIPSDIRSDPKLLADYLEENGIGITFISPKVLRYFKPSGNCLKTVITGSERLSGIWSEQFKIYNRYAMSETAGGGLQFEVDRAYDNTPVGTPTNNVSVYILDENGREASEGEICLAGHFAKGYLKLSEETKKAFVPNPFKDRDGFESLLRTGDLGCRLPDGTIVYKNRKDWMVKINGQRVETQEIEACLRRVEGITDAAVKDFCDADGEVFLAGFYVSDTEFDEEELRGMLGKWLASYMIPARFVRLKKLPVNANGKLDRSALPKPEMIRQFDSDEKPENEIQQKIFDCAADVVGHKSFGINTDLTETGLSSIGIMHLTSKLSDCFEVPVSITDLREYPTVRALESFLSAKPKRVDYEKREVYPLTRNQAGILVETLKRPDTLIYNIPWLIKLPESIDIDRLKLAADQAIAAHPYLAAQVFCDDDGNYKVKRDDDKAVTTKIIHTSALEGDLVKPFDVLSDRLCRSVIYVTDEGSYLLLDCHHIVADGTSFMILLKDIDDAYAGKTIEPEKYSGYEIALDEAACRKTKEYENSKQYYENLLSEVERDMNPKGDVSEDEMRSGFFSYISGIDHGAVRSFCQKNRVSENAFYNSVFAFVLARYNYLDEVLFSTIYNGRKDSRMDRSVTMLVKALPVVCRVSGGAAVADFIRATGEQLIKSMAADVYSFAEIAESLDVISDVMFVYQGDNFVVESFAGEKAQVTPIETGEAKESIGITAFVKDDKVTFECEYHANLYSEGFMRAFLYCMEKAAGEFLTKERISDVSILYKQARDIIEEINDTDFDINVTPVGRLFEKQVKAHPDRTAVIAGDGTLTYGQLNERANCIANKLIKLGVKTGEIVGMILLRNSDAVAAEYGIMKAGGAFMPLLPDYPDERNEYCLKDSSSRFVITTDDIILSKKDLFEGKGYTALSIRELYEEGDAQNPDISIPADSPAYCIYTSGSTGKPKGVVIRHGNLCNFTDANEKNHECRSYVNAGRTALSVAALSFDFSLMEIHLSLTNGMTLCMADDEDIRNPLKLGELITKKDVDVVSGTPSFLANLLEIPEAAKALERIKMYDLGAEAFTPVLYEKLKAASPDALIVNGYGPTEATISCISKTVTDPKDISIGRPAANVKAWIMDRDGNILPLYARGELVIGGMGVGRGYINLEEKTAEVFITVDGIPAYRTGDLAAVNKAGEIEFCGRLDDQVKLHGLRIELDEIESVMLSYPGMQRSVAAVRKNAAGEDYLCAWFTADVSVKTEDLRAHMSKSLARYMIPQAFMQLESIPMTQNGKTDKKALPEPSLQREDAVPPANETQQRIFDCVAEAVGNTDFGINTDLLDAGLTSLGAIRLNVLLFKTFGVPMTWRDIKDNDTIEKLEVFIRGGKRQEDEAEERREYAITKTQEGIFVETMEDPGTTMYNIPVLVELPEQTDLLKLKEAIAAAVNAHPYVMTRLTMNNEGRVTADRDSGRCFMASDIWERTCGDIKDIKDTLVKPYNLTEERLFRIGLIHAKKEYLFAEFHHIISDGTSMSIFFNDVNYAYNGTKLTTEKYSGYEAALAEEKVRSSRYYEEAKRYFADNFGNKEAGGAPLPDVLEDTVDGLGYLSIPAVCADGESIARFCKECGITENAFYTAAYGYVLGMFNGDEETMFATVYNGRNDPRFEKSVSMFVRTIPVLCSTDNAFVSDYLAGIGRQLMESMNHDAYSFAEISRDLGIGAGMLFVWQGQTDFSFLGEPLKKVDLALNAAKADIEFQVAATKEGLRYFVSWQKSGYTEDLIRSLAGVYDMVLRELTLRKELKDIRFADDAAISLMDSFNATQKDYEVTDYVTMFRRSVKKYQDNTAVVFHDRRYTYSQADDISERIGVFLREKVTGRGDIVGVLIPRNEYMVLASVGVYKSGAALMPLDPSYPPERLGFMVKDAGAKIIIADRKLIGTCLPEYKGELLYTDEIADLPRGGVIEDNPSPEDLFIILYTSGTTGIPKGLTLKHSNLTNFCQWARDYWNVDESVRGAVCMSYGFDVHMGDIYPELAYGGQVHIIDEDTRLDMAALQEYYEREGITHSFMTTRLCRQFAEYYTGTSLKHLTAAGEKLTPIYPDNHSYTFYNAYGPAECTIIVSINPVSRLYKRVPIGAPLANTRFYVADRFGRRLAPYMSGELLIAGRQVGCGYFNRDELNGKAFSANPFTGDKDYERVYHSGDIVRLIRDERTVLNVDFLGRNDAQVKIRGFRIELPEVEAVIREFPGIEEAAVADYETPTGEKYIAAYITAKEKIDIDALNGFIAGRKPNYMVPAVTMQIDSIPVNQNHKVNKKVLPKPEFARADKKSSGQNDRPMTKFEEEIMQIVCSILGERMPGVTDSLISYGLTSISAIGLATLLSRHFNTEIKTGRLLAGASVEDIENLIFEGWKNKSFFGAYDASHKSVKPEKEKKEYYPLTSVQLGVYYDAMKQENDTLYNVPFCVAFEGIDAEKLSDALLECVRAHPYINTYIDIMDSELVQVRNDGYVPEISIKDMSEEEFSSHKDTLIRPFNLRKSLLYRFEIVRTGERTYLFADFHHIIFDGLSLKIFMSDLARAYAGESFEEEQYTAYDYAQRQSEQVSSKSYDKAREYYRQMFTDFDEPGEIPTDISGIADEGLAAFAARDIDKQSVNEFCSRLSVTPAAMFLAILFETVSRFTSTKNIYISTIDSGRDTPEISGALGMFVHTIALGLELKTDRTAEELVKAANDLLRDSIDNEEYPFTELAADYGYHTEIMYEYQGGVIPGENGKISGIHYENVPLRTEHPKFRISLEVTETKESYVLRIIYNDALYSKRYMDKLADSLYTLSQGFIENGGEKVKKLTILTEKEKALLESYKASGSCELPQKLVHKMFEEVAGQKPDDTAVIGTDKTLSFRELNSQANVIAHNLIRRGVKRGDSVVLLLPRRSFYLACLFGVLKSGAAFIPCDPEYPRNRVTYITTNADSIFIITTERFAGDYPPEKVLLIDTVLEGEDNGNPDVSIFPEDLALMIYTSGSTGKPKGAKLRHIGVANFFTQHPANTYQQVVEKKANLIMSTATVTFDVCLMETLGFLMWGKTVLFTDENQMNNPVEFVKLFEKYPIDTISATPSRYTQYLEYKPFADMLKRCNIIIVAGEAFPNTLLAQLKALSGASIINAYAPSECTIAGNISDLRDYDYVHLGRPIQNVHNYIVDADDNPVPAGVIGELIITGIGVGSGYMNLPERTKQSFVTYNGERAYRSGDYAKWDEEGNLILLGRRDNQVKLRGLRIELNEITELMEKQPDIKKAVVIIRKVNGQDNLCAYFTARKKIDIPALKAELSRHLTKYMVPTAYMQMDDLPYTPNGKTDLKLLPEPDAVSGGEYVAPANETEKCFCDIFSEVLGIERVGAEDDFFQLGGTSLTVTGVMIKAQEEGYTLVYSEVFKYTTPRKLASFILGEDKNESTESADIITDYDYRRIDELLGNNTLEAFKNGKMQDFNNILLTGATGYMGIHVLAEFLRSEKGEAYCIVRKGKYTSAERHLTNMIEFYFEGEFDEVIKSRLHVIDGDIRDYGIFEKLEDCPVDIVFNCAANVKHFSKGTDIEDINIGGAENCVRFCEKKNIRLIHFSTTSISGAVKDGNYNALLDEQTLYCGQALKNQYTSSKFLAERLVLEAVAKGSIEAKIIRVGLLTAREADGEFQMNYVTNSFIGQLRGFVLLGAFPYSIMNLGTKMGAIDVSVKAFFKLARTPKECCLFHAYNVNTVPLVNLIRVMQECGLEIKFVEEEVFERKLKEAEKDPKKAAVLQSLFAYDIRHDDVKYEPVPENNEYTTQVLARMGFVWKETGSAYIRRFIEALKGLGFFDLEYMNR